MNTIDFVRSNARWLSAGALLTLLSSFGQTFFISLFADQIRNDFRLSHGEWGAIYSAGTFGSAVVMIWAGGLSDRYRARSLAPVILLMLALSCVAMAINPVWWGLFAVVFALRFTGQGMTSHIAIVAMSRWYSAARGRALAIATLGFSVGEAFLPILAVLLMNLIDWRFLWVGGALVCLSGIPILLTLLHRERTPQALTNAQHLAGMSNRNWTRRHALGHWLIWFMVPAMLGPSAFNTAFFFHQVYFAEIKGIAHIELVALYPLYTGISILAMITSGWALDRWGTAKLIPFMQLPMIVAFTLFATSGSLPMLAFGLIFLALNTGFHATLAAAFWPEFYGTAHIGSIKAMAAAIMVLGSAIGPGITGIGIDMGVGLERQYLFVASFFTFATILMMIGIRRAAPLLPTAS